MTDIFLPDQLYVACKESDDGPLGFMSPFGKDKAFKNRKISQDRWAYGCVVFDEQGRGTVVTWKWVVHPSTEERVKEETREPLAAELYPKVLDNELLAGFEMGRTVRRGGWSSNSVAWRVKDPRGFELEIASENLARIMDCTTIIEGVIQGRCTWGRTGSQNILLPEASEPYQLAVKNTKRTKTSVSLREVTVGDTVDVITPKLSETELIYLGKCWYRQVIANVQYLGPEPQAKRHFSSTLTNGYNYALADAVPDSAYFFKSANTGRVFTASSPKISKIVSKRAADFNLLDQLKGCTEVSGRYMTIGYFSPTKIDCDHPVTMHFEPMAEKDEWQKSSLASKIGTVVLHEGEYWSVQHIRNTSGTYDCYLVGAEPDFANATINLTTVPRAVNALFGGKTCDYRVKQIEDHTTLDPQWLVVNGDFRTKLPEMYLSFNH